ncbi:unnamed protein product [Paramecium sonneborni]|uniref:Uncharacterized protein n=1 Tax=Paramecium sonneborni TaxID=65129 RepID=A0A8S1RNQ9_9CILI|nr:unnamed protein product [Paramecium sonneborni]
MYSYNQCISNGQKNLNGQSCFWDNDKNTCLEKICQNGPSMAKSHSDCFGFLSTCQKGGCHIKNCFDYNYAIDSACASIFKAKRCVTNAYQCVLRQGCEDVNMIDSCTFDKNLNPCVLVNDKFNDLPHCTVKQEGGCTNKKSCQDYLFKEACNTNDQNEECIWDDYLNRCFYIACLDQCGNVIVTSTNEQCDDGNYLPYDGCYKCQVQSQLGCNNCNGRSCLECEKTGWIQQMVYAIQLVVMVIEQEQNNVMTEILKNIMGVINVHKQCVDCYQGQCIQFKKGYLEKESQFLYI